MRKWVLSGLLGAVLAVLVWSAWRPYRLGTWFFETVWVLVGLALVLFFWRRFPLTTLLCCLLAGHAVVLAYGGHYTYARTPVGDWVADLFGLDRNPYDRLGHFAQGFAPAIVVREILWRTSPLRGSRWLAPVTVSVALAFSAIWELLEWAGAYAVAGGDPAFLGAQGDPWDTQWDLALALVGAMSALVLLHRGHDRQLRTAGFPVAVHAVGDTPAVRSDDGLLRGARGDADDPADEQSVRGSDGRGLEGAEERGI